MSLDLFNGNGTPQGETAPQVLVIDDESINVMVLRGMLQAAGFRVLTAMDGPKGRALAKESSPGLILLDIMMPGENGFETCCQLHHDPDTTDIPIIFISALSDVENKVRGLELGAVDYITKPFEKAEVMARIRLHLKLRMAHRAVIEAQADRLRQITEAQRRILVRPEEVPEARFAIEYLPVLEAGGDFYDVFPMGNMNHCYFIADISGHDLGASFVTSSLKALVRQNSGPLYTPMETMKDINSVLKTILPNGKYLTAQACYLHRGFSRLTVVNAGHSPVIYVEASGQARFLRSEGDILGAFETICLEPINLRVDKGDRIYMFTDGLTERYTKGRRSRVEGEELLLDTCASFRGEELENAVSGIVKQLVPGDVAQEDDIVLMGIEV